MSLYIHSMYKMTGFRCTCRRWGVMRTWTSSKASTAPRRRWGRVSLEARHDIFCWHKYMDLSTDFVLLIWPVVWAPHPLPGRKGCDRQKQVRSAGAAPCARNRGFYRKTHLPQLLFTLFHHHDFTRFLISCAVYETEAQILHLGVRDAVIITKIF